ncbi:MAG: AAA family ATPase [Niastella sp.]|nr:AAA family ATPase [Niastella sp.]
MNEELIKNLLEALHLSPKNIPLRLQVADMLLKDRRYDEAIEQYREILNLNYGNNKASLGLASCYYNKQKYSAAIIIYEQIGNELIQADKVQYVKCLVKEGSIVQAQELYQQILMENPGFTDDDLDGMFRLSAGNEMDGLFDELDDDEDYFMEKPTTRFSDVGGMKKVKEEIAIKIIQPMQNPDLYKAFGKKSGGGILLFGPPGCGKTFIAKATAGEIDAKFISIGLHDILDMWIGNSEKNLHEVFEMARRNKPCVLFFDEADALGASRSDLKQSALRHTINQFLAELDGVSSNNEGVLILAATNAPWNIDPAFRRPGRFDRIIFVAPPDVEARHDILTSLLKEKPVQDIDYTKIAQATAEFSGADLTAVIDMAVEEKLRTSIQSGNLSPITTKDLLSAIKKHKPTTLEWFASARNYALYANESGQYNDILEYLKIKK